MVDFAPVFQFFLERGLGPEQVGRLTLPQVLMYTGGNRRYRSVAEAVRAYRQKGVR